MSLADRDMMAAGKEGYYELLNVGDAGGSCAGMQERNGREREPGRPVDVGNYEQGL